MGGESPSVVMYDINGNPLAVQDNTILPVNQPAILIAGSDGVNSRFISVDGYARLITVGAGTPGTPIGGILTVQGASGGTPLSVQNVTSTNTSTTSVAASATNVILLSANSNRKGATIWNDSTTATLYVKLGTTASTTSYAAQLFPTGYYEIPYGYTGEIDGIWSAAVGSARITELT